jgi:hypothetical protein
LSQSPTGAGRCAERARRRLTRLQFQRLLLPLLLIALPVSAPGAADEKTLTARAAAGISEW